MKTQINSAIMSLGRSKDKVTTGYKRFLGPVRTWLQPLHHNQLIENRLYYTAYTTVFVNRRDASLNPIKTGPSEKVGAFPSTQTDANHRAIVQSATSHHRTNIPGPCGHECLSFK